MNTFEENKPYFLSKTLVVFCSWNFALFSAILRAQRKKEAKRHVQSDDSSRLLIISREMEVMLRQGFHSIRSNGPSRSDFLKSKKAKMRDQSENKLNKRNGEKKRMKT